MWRRTKQALVPASATNAAATSAATDSVTFTHVRMRCA